MTFLSSPRFLAVYSGVLTITFAAVVVGGVAMVRNQHSWSLNLIFNANAGDPADNILMDVPDKFPGYTTSRCVSRRSRRPWPP